MEKEGGLLHKMFEMHIKHCDDRDLRTTKSIDEIKQMFRGIWDANDRMSDKVTNLQIKLSFFLGGLVVVGKIVDHFLK